MFEDVFSLLVVAGWEMCGDDEHDTLCQGFDGESMHHIVTLALHDGKSSILLFVCKPSDPIPIQYNNLRTLNVFLQVNDKIPTGEFYFEKDEFGVVSTSFEYGWIVAGMSSIESVISSIEEVVTILVEIHDRCWQAVQEVSRDKNCNPMHVVRLSFAQSLSRA